MPVLLSTEGKKAEAPAEKAEKTAEPAAEKTEKDAAK